MDKSLILILLFLVSSCVSSTGVLDEDLVRAVPDKSSVFIIHTESDNQVLFDNITRQLIRDGNRLQANNELLTIETEGIDIGQSTFARYTLYIEDGTVTGRANWMVGTEAHAMSTVMSGVNINANWEKAEWSMGRPKLAYASLIDFMMQFEHTTHEFQ